VQLLAGQPLQVLVRQLGGQLLQLFPRQLLDMEVQLLLLGAQHPRLQAWLRSVVDEGLGNTKN